MISLMFFANIRPPFDGKTIHCERISEEATKYWHGSSSQWVAPNMEKLIYFIWKSKFQQSILDNCWISKLQYQQLTIQTSAPWDQRSSVSPNHLWDMLRSCSTPKSDPISSLSSYSSYLIPSPIHIKHPRCTVPKSAFIMFHLPQSI